MSYSSHISAQLISLCSFVIVSYSVSTCVPSDRSAIISAVVSASSSVSCSLSYVKSNDSDGTV